MEARTMQLRMCMRPLQLWPRAGEYLPMCFRRTARWCDQLQRATRIPRWDSALLSVRWVRAMHFARLASRDMTRLLLTVLHWREAASRQSLRALLLPDTDPSRRRLGTHRIGRPVTRWEDPIQTAQDGTVWESMEASFVQRDAHPSPELDAVPHRRWMIHDTPP